VAAAEQEPSPWRALGRVGLLGTTLVAATVVGLVLGYWLDRWLGSAPWLTMAGTLLGIAAGYVQIIRAVRGEGDER
jgi:ATP synthase protein I